ncbi:MAG TPA: DNRLRE domain-containing protein [Tepidisphaeraceae bacterium]
MLEKTRKCVGFGAMLLFFGASGEAATVTIGAAKDAMIFGTSANVDTGNASGKGPAIFAGADGGSSKKRGLIQFDIGSAGIPVGSTITDVTLTLYLAQVAGSGGGSGGGNYPTRIFGLYDVLQDWGEGNSGSPTSPGVGGTGQGYPRGAGDSTWDYAVFDPSNLNSGKWTAGGIDLHGGNFAATASATSTFTVFTTLNTPYTWNSPSMVADVQACVNGTSPNFGWLLRSENLETSPTSFLGFWTKDGAAANNNPAIALPPSLTITYVVPEPGAVLPTFMLAVIVRRKCRR